MFEIIPLFGLPGGPEMLIILLIIVLLFGANKLPELARSSGQAIGEFHRGREAIEEEIRGTREESLATATVDDETVTETEPATNV